MGSFRSSWCCSHEALMSVRPAVQVWVAQLSPILILPWGVKIVITALALPSCLHLPLRVLDHFSNCSHVFVFSNRSKIRSQSAVVLLLLFGPRLGHVFEQAQRASDGDMEGGIYGGKVNESVGSSVI